jgi:hypothetical protein
MVHNRVPKDVTTAITKNFVNVSYYRLTTAITQNFVNVSYYRLTMPDRSNYHLLLSLTDKNLCR